MNDLIETLENTIASLLEEKAALWRELINAKNPEPIKRISFERVKRLANSRCLDLHRVMEEKTITLSNGREALERYCCKGFKVTLGHLERVFKSLKALWEFLSQESWSLSDLFPQMKEEEEKKPDDEPKPKKQSYCKWCSSPIHWVRSVMDNRFLPYEENGLRHKCSPRSLVPI